MLTAGIWTTVMSDVAVLVHQFGPYRFGEPIDGVFGAAVGGLQRDGARAQRGSDLHDRAGIAGPHAGQRGHGAVYET